MSALQAEHVEATMASTPEQPGSALGADAARATGHELAALTRVLFGLTGLAGAQHGTDQAEPAAAPAVELPPGPPAHVEVPPAAAAPVASDAPSVPLPPVPPVAEQPAPPAGLPVPGLEGIPLPDAPAAPPPPAAAPPAADPATTALPLPEVPLAESEPEAPVAPEPQPRQSGRHSLELLQEIAFLDE